MNVPTAFVSFLLLFIVSLPVKTTSSSSSPSSSSFQDEISWPKAYDDFDEHLINLARNKRQTLGEDEDAEGVTTTTPAPGSKNITKNYTIDWNEVEANWVKTISEQEVAEKWNKMEKGLQNGSNTLFSFSSSFLSLSLLFFSLSFILSPSSLSVPLRMIKS